MSAELADPVNGFFDTSPVAVANAKDGPLVGKTLAVKDIFDVAGFRTGCGNPTKLAQAQPARRTAPAVQTLLDNGARFVGKSLTDELAFSLNGQNAHYGAPINSRAAGRITGGSSCGSAALVAAGVVDIATGSDTGGSIRAPASYCGLIGLRTTWGRISLEDTMPLAPSFDTFGWFAGDMSTYQEVAECLLGPDDPAGPELRRAILVSDAMAQMIGDQERNALQPALDRLAEVLGSPGVQTLAPDGLEAWHWTFRHHQAYEAWQCHGAWIEEAEPQLGPGVVDRFYFGRDLEEGQFSKAAAHRREIRARVADLIGDDGVLILPTMPGIAPPSDMDFSKLDDFRNRAISILCIAGLCGLPQITLPLAQFNGCPLGVSLIGPAGRDGALLHLGGQIMGDA